MLLPILHKKDWTFHEEVDTKNFQTTEKNIKKFKTETFCFSFEFLDFFVI